MKAGLGLRGCDSSQAFRLRGEEADFDLVACGRLSGFILEGQVSSSSADVDAGLSLQGCNELAP